jgi:hypothetical protein
MPLREVRTAGLRGLAASMCGKVLPLRDWPSIPMEAMPPVSKLRQSLVKKTRLSESHRLSAHQAA